MSSNLYFGGNLGGISGVGFQKLDPGLTLDPAGIYRPSLASPVIGVAVSVFGLDISLDIDEQGRQVPFDIGADERDSTLTRGPLTRCDVGPTSFSYGNRGNCDGFVTTVPKSPLGLVVTGS